MTLQELHEQTTARGWAISIRSNAGGVVCWLREQGSWREFVAVGATLAEAVEGALRRRDVVCAKNKSERQRRKRGAK